MSAKLQSSVGWESSILGFLSHQKLHTVGPVPKGTSFSGQTAIVTGANAGLGFDCCRQLLELDLSHLIIAVRSQAKGDEAAKRLQTQFPFARIEVSILDMASHVSVQAFARRCEQLSQLDIVILNAGINVPTFSEAKETGHEMTFQVNYLSTALLTLLLIPILKFKHGAQGPAHLATVGSDTMYWAPWKNPRCKSVFALVDGKENFTAMNTYMVSKLLLMLFVEKLCHLVSPKDIIINYPNPGMCQGTAIMGDREPGLQTKMMAVMGKVLGRTTEVGARQYVHAVIGGPESHGSYLSEQAIKPYAKIMYTDDGRALQTTLWDETMKELEFAHVSSIVNAR